jgi:sterol 14alpha-demethylase
VTTTSTILGALRREPRAGDAHLAPAVPGGAPFLGQALEFWRHPVELLSRGREQYGEIFRFHLAGRDVNVMTGPKANKAFFHAPETTLSARECYQFTVPVFGQGVAYDVTSDVMDQQLSWVHPALSEKRLRTYAQVMGEEAETYLDRWGDAGEVDLFDVTQDLTTFIATRCLLGQEVRRHLTTEFARLYHDLDGGMNLIAYFLPNAPLPSFRRRDKARADVNALLSKVMADRRKNGGEHEDFLQTLMDARYEDGTTLPDHVISGLLLTLIFAGQHTSAVLAAWTGILLHQHPGYLPAVTRELDEVFGEGRVTIEGLRKIPVLERAVKEAERLRPPLVMLMRMVLQDMEYAGKTLPAGSLAMVTPAVSHRIPEIFKNPHAFDPDRYAPGREEDRKQLYSLIGFGGGKHRCMGMVFAYQQVKAIWAVLLRRFELELCDADYRPNYTTFVVGPHQPCRVRYRRRKPASASVPADLGAVS